LPPRVGAAPAVPIPSADQRGAIRRHGSLEETDKLIGRVGSHRVVRILIVKAPDLDDRQAAIALAGGPPHSVDRALGPASNALTGSVGKDDVYYNPRVPAGGVIGCLANLVFILRVLPFMAWARL
jgi:hypothetical protein